MQGNIAVGPNEELIWYDFGMMSQLQVTTKERLLGKVCSAPILPVSLYLVTVSGFYALCITCCRAVLWRCPEGCCAGHCGPASSGHHCGSGGHPQPEASHHLLPEKHCAAGEVSGLCVGAILIKELQDAVAGTAYTHDFSSKLMPSSEQRHQQQNVPCRPRSRKPLEPSGRTSLQLLLISPSGETAHC